MRAIKSADAEALGRLYEQSFSGIDLPYGQSLDEQFFSRRLFSSRLYSTDCSLIEYGAREDIGAAVLANLRQFPNQKTTDIVYLNLLILKPDDLGSRCGKQLITELLNYARSLHKEKIITSLQWIGVWPGLLSTHKQALNICLTSGARITGEDIFLESDINNTIDQLRSETIQPLKDTIFRHYQSNDFDSLYRLLAGHFSIGWLHETMSKVSNNFESFNGYGLSATFRPEDIFVVEHESELCGFCVVQSDTDDDLCFFGPMGIEPKCRGKGIGSRLLLKALQYLIHKNKKRVGLWTSESIYRDFYKRFGMQKTISGIHLQWIL